MSTVPGIKSQSSLKVTDTLQLILKAKIRSDTKKWQKSCGISPSSLNSCTIRFSRKLSDTSNKTRIHPRDALITASISAMHIFPRRRCLETNSILHPKENAPSPFLIPSAQSHIQCLLIPSLCVFLCLPSQSLSADGNILEMVALFR